jgi:hypothetical protein
MIYKRRFLGIPIGRRSNRRWLITAYWVIAIAIASLSVGVLQAHPKWSEGSRILFTYACIFCGYTAIGRLVWDSSLDPQKVSGGIRTLFDSALKDSRKRSPPMDERERHERDKAYRSAYGYLGLIAFLLFIFYAYGLIPRTAQTRAPLLWFVLLLYLNLPESMLIWNEPDMEEPQ